MDEKSYKSLMFNYPMRNDGVFVVVFGKWSYAPLYLFWRKRAGGGAPKIAPIWAKDLPRSSSSMAWPEFNVPRRAKILTIDL